MKFKPKMLFGGLSLVHIISQRKLDESEGGRTEISLSILATEVVRLNHSHSETLPTARS